MQNHVTLARILTKCQAPRGILGRVSSSHGGPTKAMTALRKNPYRVLREAGGSLDLADRVAESLKLSMERRLCGHAEWTLAKSSVLSMSMLVAKLRFSLEMSDATVRRLLKKTLDAGHLMEMDGQVMSMDHFDKNVSIARDIQQRALVARNAQLLAAFENVTDLTQEQRAALGIAATHRLSVITGGPGTGKSRIVRSMLDAVPTAKVTAPTGRAARNASGKTVHYFRTIQESGSNDFAGSGLIIVDEASMLSTELMWTVLHMAPAEAHIVLVGDVDQLPPIDAGDVLRDIIGCGRVPVTTLRHNHRSSSAIQTFAASLLRGEPIIPETHAIKCIPCETLDNVINIAPTLTSNIILTPHNVTRIALNKAVQMYRWATDDELEIKLTKDFPGAPRGTPGLITSVTPTMPPLFNIVADNSTALRAMPAAAANLIEIDASRAGGIVGESTIIPGDSIIITKNTPDVCNGDIGIFLAGGAETCRVTCNGNVVDVPAVSEDDLGFTLAYAVTVHKAQGSEFRCVTLPVVNVNAWDRSLLYTAITRAQEEIHILGSLEDLQTIAKNVRPPRSSVLRDMLL